MTELNSAIDAINVTLDYFLFKPIRDVPSVHILKSSKNFSSILKCPARNVTGFLVCTVCITLKLSRSAQRRPF